MRLVSGESVHCILVCAKLKPYLLKTLHAMNKEDPDHKHEFNEFFLCMGEENKSFPDLSYLMKLLSD
jgi:hypothetical protein